MEKIKVVFVHYKLVCGGAEQALLDLVTLLDKEKFSVSVFVQVPGGEWEHRFLDAGIDVVYDYSCRKPTWNPLKKLGNFRKKLQVSQAHSREGKGLLDICCPGADLVVDYSAWCASEISFASGAKHIKYIHGDPATNPVYRKEAEEEQDRLARFHRIVCVSQKAAEAFRSITGLGDRVEMHYNPIHSEAVRQKARQSVDLPRDLPLICAVGRLAEEKGFERLLLVHRCLLDQGIRHRLVIVGDGPERGILTRLIRALKLEDTVILAGYQQNPYPYMAAARCLVSSSYTEGLPVIAMEAMSLGIPMVATLPGVAETFGGRDCGIITENTVEGLEAGIRRMLTDQDFYEKARTEARARADFFDGKRMVRETEQMYLKVVQEP